MKRMIPAIAATLVFTLLVSCSNTPNDSIIGVWKKGTYILTVNANGTQRGQYTIPSDPTQYDVTGNYELMGDTFRFVNLAGVSSCPVGDTGTYRYSVHNDVLNLVLISDQCSGRGASLPGNYDRQ